MLKFQVFLTFCELDDTFETTLHSNRYKQELVQQNLGRVFNFKYGHVCTTCTSYAATKLSNLYRKLSPKQLLCYLPLAFTLSNFPNVVFYEFLGPILVILVEKCIENFKSAKLHCKTDV